MSIGKSGRIVVEVDPDLKRSLYSELATNGLSLKEWFVDSAMTYLKSNSQVRKPPSESKEEI